MKNIRPISVFGVLIALAAAALGVVLYAQGYRLDLTRGAIDKTGIILAKSIPEGAKVWLDGKPITATNSPISNLKPGTYHLKLEKEGRFSWEKDVPVEEGLVTDITALLPPLSPSLTAATQNGVKLVTRAPSGRRAAFISPYPTGPAGKARVYTLNLSSPALGFLRTAPQEIAEENEEFPLSEATALRWSPNEDQILVSTETNHYLISASGRNGSPSVVPDITALLEAWDIAVVEQRTALTRGSELDQELATEAAKPTTLWAPDERKFLYEKKLSPNGDGAERRQFWLVDLSDPLPVGDEAHRLVWETESETLKLFWLADSHHFVMVEEGIVSILDLDGSNKRDLFQGTIAEEIALSTTDLSKIIIVTSLAPEAPANLYAISLK